jgi:hypothetical protein
MLTHDERYITDKIVKKYFIQISRFFVF